MSIGKQPVGIRWMEQATACRTAHDLGRLVAKQQLLERQMKVERRRQPIFVGGQRDAMIGPSSHITGRQTGVKCRHTFLEPAHVRLANFAEPHPVVTEHYGDGVVERPAVQQPGQQVGRHSVHGRRGVQVVVAERVQPEHGKVPVTSVQLDEILDVTEHPVRNGPGAHAEVHAMVFDHRQKALGRQHVRPRVIVGWRVPKTIFAEVKRAYARFVFHVRRNVT